ncbi:hypothetical protein [Modestobacter marinus]|uniref:hypothetical protein n=1 Tax=Modestobacter marinus TaxID=477641 RepID=UPI001C94729A|nr:hypothetical protein [Modestobacter marinus]
MGPSQVTLGSDYPFDMGVDDPVDRPDADRQGRRGRWASGPIADVFRPDGDEPVPVIACISPYGKDVPCAERFDGARRMSPGVLIESPHPGAVSG